MNSKYLGDGVYLSCDGYQLWLAVNNHENEVVALEQEVFERLITTGIIEFAKGSGKEQLLSVLDEAVAYLRAH